MPSSSKSAGVDLHDDADWPFTLGKLLNRCAEIFPHDVPVHTKRRDQAVAWLMDNLGDDAVETNDDLPQFRFRIKPEGRWVIFGSRHKDHHTISFRKQAEAAAFKLVWYVAPSP